jgi:hypothetical protein
MMKLYLLKSWQLFMLTMLSAILSAVFRLKAFSPALGPEASLILSQGFSYVFVLSFAFWIWGMGIALSRLSPNRRVDTGFFHFNILFATLYRMSLDSWSTVHLLQTGESPELGSMIWIIPLHVYALLGVLYCIYEDARLLVSAEEGQPQAFRQFRKTFLQILFFPVGLWSVQPRLRKLFGLGE